MRVEEPVMNWFYWILGSLNVLMWGAALIFTTQIRKIGQLRLVTTTPSPGELPLVSVVIAARNEQKALERCIESLVSQTYSHLEICVVNDRSDDGTAEIIERMSSRYSNVTGLEITSLPENWIGKSHALWQGTKQANGSWLLFTDADILFHPDCLEKAVAYSWREGLDHLTLIPEFQGPHLLSKWYSTFIFLAASSFGMLWKVRKVGTSQSFGVGAFNLVKREVYDAIGTHEAISYVTTDDATLGKRIKQAGYKQDVLYGNRLVSVWNWYESAGQLIRSVEKSVFSIPAAIVTSLNCILTMIYPWVGLFVGPMSARILCAVSLLAVMAQYAIYSRHSGSGFWYGIAHPLVGLLLIVGGLGGAIRASRRGGMTWRGTTYDRKNLKA